MGDPYTMENPCSKRINVLYEELKKRGHEPIILAPDTPGIEKKEGVIYCSTPELKKKTTWERIKNQGCLALSSYRNGIKLKDIDIVFTTCPPPINNLAGAKIAKKLNAKLIYDVRDIWPDVALEMGSFSENSIYSKTFRWMRDYMLEKADIVTAVSPGKVKKLETYTKKRVICVPNGFNNNFLSISMNQELFKRIRSKGKVICSYVGNIGLAQGIDKLIYLAEKSRESKLPIFFSVYGFGVEEKKLRQDVIDKGLVNISFEGRLPNKDMRTVLEASDISFVPLVNSNLKDSVPTKLYEALGVGCPVFLVAEGDSADILREVKLGMDVTPNDKDIMWDRFLQLYSSLDEIKQNRGKAMDMIHKEYSLQKSAVFLVDEMEQLIAKE
ncbi:glycosyltransferase family 4 protein [Butyrivibrio sp. WCE2006]|uniref:glycosyltransferase family 4 protein n=1 Tax=Butyrivibrio sp. WCE2006 TaxID=1410611 RepID=UPI0018CC69A2